MSVSGRGARQALAMAVLAAIIGGAAVGAAVPTSPTSPASPAPSTLSAPQDLGAEDIRDIRGPKSISPPWLLAALAAGAAILGLGAYAAWRWHRRRRPSAVLSPFEMAMQRLAEIRALMQPQSVREFAVAVSDTVRRYIELQFHIIASHRTTEEFLRDNLASPSASLARHHGLLAEFLQQCDIAKFAGLSLSRQSMEALHESACTFVRESAVPAGDAQGSNVTIPAAAA